MVIVQRSVSRVYLKCGHITSTASTRDGFVSKPTMSSEEIKNSKCSSSIKTESGLESNENSNVSLKYETEPSQHAGRKKKKKKKKKDVVLNQSVLVTALEEEIKTTRKPKEDQITKSDNQPLPSPQYTEEFVIPPVLMPFQEKLLEENFMHVLEKVLKSLSPTLMAVLSEASHSQQNGLLTTGRSRFNLGCQIRMLGSSASTLALKTSDLNLELFIPPECKAPLMLRTLAEHLEEKDKDYSLVFFQCFAMAQFNEFDPADTVFAAYVTVKPT
uniref:Uncharacterized protein n=1 Tax=Timema poppense TaxID=170557 RepID=A0A7R9CJ76_TIMPO|nr:unnamed protein product [Timema poppensis]